MYWRGDIGVMHVCPVDLSIPLGPKTEQKAVYFARGLSCDSLVEIPDALLHSRRHVCALRTDRGAVLFILRCVYAMGINVLELAVQCLQVDAATFRTLCGECEPLAAHINLPSTRVNSYRSF